MTGFEGSFLGNAGRIDSGTLMECGVCWWVYDPRMGDDVWQIAANTPFSELPDHWRCPSCDATQAQFMALNTIAPHDADTVERPQRHAGMDTLKKHQQELEQAYHQVQLRMRSLPVHNDALEVEIVGMRRCQYGYICVAATPWCMNLLVISTDSGQRREGTSRDLTFASGSYSFTTGHLPGVGDIETCSLFSPMEVFDDPTVVRSVAAHAIDALFVPPQHSAEASAKSNPKPSLSRREFLRPGNSL